MKLVQYEKKPRTRGCGHTGWWQSYRSGLSHLESRLPVYRYLLHTQVGGNVSLATVEQSEGVPLIGEGFPVMRNHILDHKKEHQIEPI